MSHKTPFQLPHALEFGLLISGRDTKSLVTSMMCRFCACFKRAEQPWAKRQWTENTKYYSTPFRKENYEKHNSNQHPVEWEKYKKASKEEKMEFFETMKSISIERFICTSGDIFEFIVDSKIVEDIVAQPFLRPDDDLDMLSLEKSMALFKKVPDTTTSCCITIRNVKRFELALDHTSIGLSFHQTSAVIDQHKEAFGNAKLVGLNDHIVSQYVRVGVAINLQRISDILSSLRIWSFALAADSSTHRSNLHLIVVPFYDRHTTENIAAMICHILDALYARWRSKIIAFSIDGENTMTGRHAGVVTRIDHECETKLMRIWCALHQIDLVVKDVSHSLNDGLFYKTAHDFSVHLRRQQNLQLEMGNTCPKDTNRWVHLERMLSWMLEHRRQLLIWIDEKKPAFASDDSWWLMTGGVRPLLELVNVTLVILQSPNLILSQQTSEIKNLVGHLVSTMNMELVGSWARNMFLVLDAANQTSILKEIAHFGLKLVQGISAIQAERNSNNEVALDFGIPVMPFQLVEMASCDFIDSVLDPYRSQLAKFWPDEKIDLIERHQQELFNAYKREPGSKLFIDKQDHTTFFNTGWDDLKGRFEHLRMFCSGLANAFAN
ncbi:hypothetical protein BDL97_14G024200 [Sphagnum fallax]|nr:hypothetical protein BDL97_14G024200 [Sphagnum fallax]